MSCTRTKYYSGNEIKKNEVRGACGPYERRATYRILVGKPAGNSHLEYIGIDGRIILKKSVGECVEWIDLAKGRDKRWAVVNTVMNFLAA
jgi:hypothetical protein